VEWQATDQFGNLYVGESDAQSLEELRPHLAMLIEELHLRAPGPIQITIDLAYAEINGPDPEQVAFVMQVPWLSSQDAASLSPLSLMIGEINIAQNGDPIAVVFA
jgi:hypothetical protein